MTAAVWALWMVPAVAGLAGLLLPTRSRRRAAALAVAAAAVALLLGVVGLAAGDLAGSVRLADVTDVVVTASVRLDRHAAAVAIAVALVALLVQLYSVSYLSDDDRYAPYAAQISLFTAAMLLVVTADDLVLLLIGWEVMGACSYLLIGHDRRLPAAPAAAVKAFLVTRVGDIGFLLGVLLLGGHAGTFRIGEILARLDTLDGVTLTAAALLILAGAAGKSAQFPLHTWLPDAMAGPTPISALIHAATMVAAGAYVLVRLLPLYAATPVATTVIAVVAAITMLGAAGAALASEDLKRVLAWSTVSQVAFMFGGVAVLAGDAALFHLLGHAGFKALLFLCAGAVIHVVGSNALARMGGLRRGAPVTFWTMTIGFAALAGLPPLSGFWSKESVLGAAEQSHTVAGALVWWCGLATVVLTAAYSTRAWLLVFFGTGRDTATTPHDPPPLMRWPLLVLAVPAAGAGLLGATALFDTPVTIHVGQAALVAGLALLGGGAVWLWWRTDPATDPMTRSGAVGRFLAAGLGVDAAQRFLVVRAIRALARTARRGDTVIVDGAVEGSATGTGALAGLLAVAHRPGLPRHLLAGTAGVLVLGALTLAVYWGVTW